MGTMETLIVFLEIVMINLLLSGDNAIVIAMAGRRLPIHQRRKAVWWGAIAAIGLRCVLTLGAIKLLHIPYLQTAGAILLLIIALQLLLDNKEKSANTHAASTLTGAVWTIVVADFVMSLDNVLAVAAVANGDTAMLIIGIVMSIPIIIWGSSFIMRVLDRLPGLLYLGGGLLGYTAAKMALSDPGWAPYGYLLQPAYEKLVPLMTVTGLLVLALFIRRKH
ncbi:YjbE family putative metal transport protein [Cohnella luojiensis]|uniref:TerC family protein n=1 Tax=Cohnella luojiensis TaxID=652876 RepID=A0A4Y8M8U0_9BACL|nr:YjbE family putative metal transport protein [Cohnella luojiensis]TFE31701.1 TerC family protein [Cohnella luojiensis]